MMHRTNNFIDLKQDTEMVNFMAEQGVFDILLEYHFLDPKDFRDEDVSLWFDEENMKLQRIYHPYQDEEIVVKECDLNYLPPHHAINIRMLTDHTYYQELTGMIKEWLNKQEMLHEEPEVRKFLELFLGMAYCHFKIDQKVHLVGLLNFLDDEKIEEEILVYCYTFDLEYSMKNDSIITKAREFLDQKISELPIQESDVTE